MVYRGPPKDNNNLTTYSEDGETFLPEPHAKADGFLQAYLRPLPDAAQDAQFQLSQFHPAIASNLREAGAWHTSRGWSTGGPYGPALDLSLHTPADFSLSALPDGGAYVGPLFPPRLPRGGHINSCVDTLFLEQPNAADGIASGDEGDPFDDEYWDSDLENGD